MVVKIIELIGSSPEGWQKATQNAIDEAAKTINNIKSVHVKRCTAKVEKNKSQNNIFSYDTLDIIGR